MRLATERLRLVAISLRVTNFHDGFAAPLAVVLGSRPTLAPEDLHRPGPRPRAEQCMLHSCIIRLFAWPLWLLVE